MYYFDDSRIVDGLSDLHNDVSDLRAELRNFQSDNFEVLTGISNTVTFVSVLILIILGVKVMFSK